MQISENNKLNITDLTEGQRVIRVGDMYFPVGKGGVDAGGSGNNSSASIAKVTNYIPYSPSFNGTTEIIVSGIGFVGNQEEEWGEDYSEANGKYIVTEDTYYETDEKKRIYKHESKNYWILSYDDTENWWYDGCYYWMITPYENDTDLYSSVVCIAEDSIPVGVAEWYNYNYDMTVDIGITTTIIDKPEQPLVLQGQMVTSYDPDNMNYIFSTSIIDFDGFDIEPKNGELYNVYNNRLIGSTLGFNPGEMESNAVMYSNPGADAGVAVQGRIVPYMHKTVIDGVPCVWFDIETAGAQNDAGIGSRESYAYIPLSKMITLHRPDVMPVPKPPYNQLSIVGTMYSSQWGNSGHIIGLSKEVVAPTGQWGGDGYRGVFLGVNFDPNWGFKVDSATGYPADYKKMYNEFNGKWMQFVLTVSENNVRLYFNSELRVTAYNIDFSGYNPAEFNYLFFRQSDGMGELMHFGKMYAFDRVLSESEITRLWKNLSNNTLPVFSDLPSDYVFRASFKSSITADTGQQITIHGNPSITTKNGINCAYFDGDDGIDYPSGLASGDNTYSAWIYINPSDYNDYNNKSATAFKFDVGEYIGLGFSNKAYKVNPNGELVHVAYVSKKDPDESKYIRSLWINGALIYQDKVAAYSFSPGIAPENNSKRFKGYIAEALIYNRALEDREIKQLASQYSSNIHYNEYSDY